MDVLERNTVNNLILPQNYVLPTESVEEGVKAKLNSRLFINFNKEPTGKLIPGNVLKIEDNGVREGLSKCVFKNTSSEDCVLCIIIITPECDLANTKSFCMPGEDRVHRIVYGLLYLANDTFANERRKMEEKGQDSRFTINPFDFDENRHMMVIHLGSLSTMRESELREKIVIFSLQRDLLFDLQSKASNHVNRLGNYQIE